MNGQPSRIWFHWQNLTRGKRRFGGLVHGRAWLHLWSWMFNWEWHFWGKRCHASVDIRGVEDHTLAFAFAIPPVSLYFNITAPHKSLLNRMLPAGMWETRIAIFDWAIWVNPFSRQHDWRRDDPWWIRGFTIHLDDLILGDRKHIVDECIDRQPVVIQLDGRDYHGEARFERDVWKRPRWFAKTRDATWIDMEPGEGLPHAGKGENSWDCGDDALCGWGVEGHDIEKAIGSGIEKLLKYRRRYGMPSCVA